MYEYMDKDDRYYHQRLFKNNQGYKVKMPGGENYFVNGQRANFPSIVNQHQHRSEIHMNHGLEGAERIDKSYQNKNYDRSLAINDIEGTKPGTLISKVVKNKDLAGRYGQLYHQGQNPDSLDNFMRQSQGNYQGRQAYFDDRRQQYRGQSQPSNNLYDNDAYYVNKKSDSQDYNPRQEFGGEQKFVPRQQLQNQDSQIDDELERLKQQKQQLLDEKIRKLEEEEEQILRKKQQEQLEKQRRQEEEARQYELEQIRRQQEQREQENNQKTQLREQELQKQSKLEALEREIEDLKKQSQIVDVNQQRLNQQEQDLQQQQFQQPSMDVQRQQAQQNLSEIYQNRQRQETEHLQQRVNVQDKILEQQRPQIGNHTYKLDINGFPVYQKLPRVSPTNFSYGGEELKGQQQGPVQPLSYGILDNNIIPKTQRANSKDNRAGELGYEVNSKHFKKFPGELDAHASEQNLMERQRELQARQGNPQNNYHQDKDLESKHRQIQQQIEQEENRKYMEKLEKLKEEEQYRSLEKYQTQSPPRSRVNTQGQQDVDPRLHYNTEYKMHYKPELEKSKPLGPFQNSYQRQVYPHHQHSKLNALGSIPNAPHDTIETAKQIIKPPSAEQETRKKQEYEDLKQRAEGSTELDGKYRFPNKDEERDKKMRQFQEFYEKEQKYNQQLAGLSANFRDTNQKQRNEQYGRQDGAGTQFMDMDQNGGKALKNISKLRMY